MGDVVPIHGEELPARLFEIAPVPDIACEALGQQLFADMVNEMAAAGAVIPKSVIAVAARHGKAALEDGCEQDVVLAGCLLALKQGKGRYAQDYISEMALVKAGLHLSKREYEQQIARYKKETSPTAAAARDLLERSLRGDG